jgi:hypothetical protein
MKEWVSRGVRREYFELIWSGLGGSVAAQMVLWVAVVHRRWQRAVPAPPPLPTTPDLHVCVEMMSDSGPAPAVTRGSERIVRSFRLRFDPTRAFLRASGSGRRVAGNRPTNGPKSGRDQLGCPVKTHGIHYRSVPNGRPTGRAPPVPGSPVFLGNKR